MTSKDELLAGVDTLRRAIEETDFGDRITNDEAFLIALIRSRMRSPITSDELQTIIDIRDGKKVAVSVGTDATATQLCKILYLLEQMTVSAPDPFEQQQRLHDQHDTTEKAMLAQLGPTLPPFEAVRNPGMLKRPIENNNGPWDQGSLNDDTDNLLSKL